MTSFLLLEVFFIAFFPANRTEVDDGYWYATDIRDSEYLELFNPRFFLFLPIVKLFYNTFSSLGLTLDAYDFMCVISIVFSGMMLILLYDTLCNYLKFQKKTAFAITVFVTISYEYWRYSVEAEVYVMSMFFILLTLRLFLKYKHTRKFGHVFLLSALAAFTTLLYKPNFIPLFVVFPLLFLYYRKIGHLVIYYSLSAIIIVGGFYIVHVQLSPGESFIGYLFGGTNHPIGNPMASTLVIASNIMSVLWVFSFDEATTFIVNGFPHKVIEEEVFLAQQVGELKYFLLLVLVATIVIFCWFVGNAIRKRKNFSVSRFRMLLVLVLWVLLYGGFLMLMDPTSNEPWLMLQVPIIILFGALLIEPLKRNQYWVIYGFLTLVFINNFLGGMNLLKDIHYDYYYQKSKWLISNATEKDYVISYGPVSFIRYMRYHTDAKVINLEEEQKTAIKLLQNAGKLNGGKVYLSENIFHPPRAILYRSQFDIEQLFNIYKDREYRSELVWGRDNEQFTTYKLIMNN
ncbi:DUF2723 domain-containing protein [Fulvivirga sp. 29W222]|uniref:DUF2723 domain-containing protein n=1 Tax=Fulvivirga marina TaxID=2494733 RepID=A0A937G2Q4_9BACT|nr:DUF2723 domain-containing protein [Fulvivirga marina]MBL6448905.1 DUF2723 domain-containing protein [Fulvivirga marina]